jgi:hypothetical protein
MDRSSGLETLMASKKKAGATLHKKVKIRIPGATTKKITVGDANRIIDEMRRERKEGFLGPHFKIKKNNSEKRER